MLIIFFTTESISDVPCWMCISFSNSPHTLPLRTDPGRQYRVAFLLSNDLGSATIISDDTWKVENGCLLSVRLSRLVSCSSALSKRFWLTISAESFLDRGSGMLAGKKEWCWEKLQLDLGVKLRLRLHCKDLIFWPYGFVPWVLNGRTKSIYIIHIGWNHDCLPTWRS